MTESKMNNDALEEMAMDLENKIMFVVGEAMGYNGFTKKRWIKKYGKKVLCQVVNEICLHALKTLVTMLVATWIATCGSLLKRELSKSSRPSAPRHGKRMRRTSKALSFQL